MVVVVGGAVASIGGESASDWRSRRVPPDVSSCRLFEDDYTLDDVVKIIESLSVVVKASLQSELIKEAQQNAVLVVSLLAQAEKRSVWLDIDPLALESGYGPLRLAVSDLG